MPTLPTDSIKVARLTDLKRSLLHVLDDFNDISKTHLSDDGLKCCDSQLICLSNTARDLEHLVNGITVSDLIKTTHPIQGLFNP